MRRNQWPASILEPFPRCAFLNNCAPTPRACSSWVRRYPLHDIYLEDAVLEYRQSGERIRGRRNIQITRTNQPSKQRFAVRRVIGSGDLWITEYVLTYDGKPS